MKAVVGNFNKENAFSGHWNFAKPHWQLYKNPIYHQSIDFDNNTSFEKIPLWLAADGDGEAGAQNWQGALASPPSFEAVLSIILLERCNSSIPNKSINVKIEGLVVLVYDLILN